MIKYFPKNRITTNLYTKGNEFSLNSGILGTPGQSDDWQIVDYNFNRIDSIVDPYSIGVQAIFDYKYRRYILTKKDYTFDIATGILGYVGNIPLNAFIISNGFTKAWYNGYIYTLYNPEFTPAPPANAEYLVTRGEVEVYGVKTDFNSIFTLDSFVTASAGVTSSFATLPAGQLTDEIACV